MPISVEEACRLADRDVESHPLDDPDYKLSCKLVCAFDGGWLFSNKINCLRDIPVDRQEKFAGSPGFVIELNGQIRHLAHYEYHELLGRIGVAVPQ